MNPYREDYRVDALYIIILQLNVRSVLHQGWMCLVAISMSSPIVSAGHSMPHVHTVKA